MSSPMFTIHMNQVCYSLVHDGSIGIWLEGLRPAVAHQRYKGQNIPTEECMNLQRERAEQLQIDGNSSLEIQISTGNSIFLPSSKRMETL